jgi:hypothetical protein
MLWKYALALTLSGFALFGFVLLCPKWGPSWSMAFLAQLLVQISIALWLVALFRWLKSK